MTVLAHERHARRDKQRRYSSGDAASRRGAMLTGVHTEASSHEIEYRATMHSLTRFSFRFPLSMAEPSHYARKNGDCGKFGSSSRRGHMASYRNRQDL